LSDGLARQTGKPQFRPFIDLLGALVSQLIVSELVSQSINQSIRQYSAPVFADTAATLSSIVLNIYYGMIWGHNRYLKQ